MAQSLINSDRNSHGREWNYAYALIPDTSSSLSLIYAEGNQWDIKKRSENGKLMRMGMRYNGVGRQCEGVDGVKARCWFM